MSAGRNYLCRPALLQGGKLSGVPAIRVRYSVNGITHQIGPGPRTGELKAESPADQQKLTFRGFSQKYLLEIQYERDQWV
jgi:hypothetical protein